TGRGRDRSRRRRRRKSLAKSTWSKLAEFGLGRTRLGHADRLVENRARQGSFEEIRASEEGRAAGRRPGTVSARGKAASGGRARGTLVAALAADVGDEGRRQG